MFQLRVSASGPRCFRYSKELFCHHILIPFDVIAFADGSVSVAAWISRAEYFQHHLSSTHAKRIGLGKTFKPLVINRVITLCSERRSVYCSLIPFPS